MKTVILIVVTVTVVTALPPNFKKCNRKDPNFKKCYFEAAQYGVTLLNKPYKSMDLPNMEPLEVEKMTVSGGQGSVAVDQNFKNCQLHGLTAAKFDRFELNLEKKILDLAGIIPNLVFQCDYQLNGRILLLTLQGAGKSTIVLRKMHLTYHAEYEKFKKGDKTYYKTVSTKMTIDPENMSFNFENLFNGNKELGDNVNSVFNENWKEIWNEVQESYTNIIETIFLRVTDNLWKKVSLEEFFD